VALVVCSARALRLPEDAAATFASLRWPLLYCV